ncbi:uncharacterized protein ACR2FA_011941 [Aphomia sociella]
MARVSTIVLFLSFVIAIEFVSSNIIRTDVVEVNRKDQDEPNKDIMENTKLEEVTSTLVPVSPNKKCVEIGQYCNIHSDCCSNSCLGYMKRCVS